MAAQLGWKFIEIAMALQYNLQKLGHGVPYNYDYPLRVNDFRLGGLEVFSDSTGSDASGLSKSNFVECRKHHGTEGLSGARGVGETYYFEDKQAHHL